MASGLTKCLARLIVVLVMVNVSPIQSTSSASTQQPGDDAPTHNQTGVAYHLRRCLDDASREYARTISLDPPRELTGEEWAVAKRFAPRIYVTPSEFFPLKDFAVILRPKKRLIAYHFF